MGSVLPCCSPFGKAGGHQIRCCQGFAVNDYSFTLDALALKPSGFCNVGDYQNIDDQEIIWKWVDMGWIESQIDKKMD
jgi:hypothetical protein